LIVVDAWSLPGAINLGIERSFNTRIELISIFVESLRQPWFRVMQPQQLTTASFTEAVTSKAALSSVNSDPTRSNSNYDIFLVKNVGGKPARGFRFGPCSDIIQAI